MAGLGWNDLHGRVIERAGWWFAGFGLRGWDGDTFALYTDAGLTAAVDGTGYGAYEDASPNTAAWKTIIPKTSAETLTITYSLTFPAD